jgi:scyllo-inositol 2-dehydrogenase (NADP+)
MSGQPIGTALIGFGLAGEVFHAPLIGSTKALELRAVVSSRTDAIAAAGLRSASGIGAVLADPSVDLVVVATPNATHYPLAREALMAGKHVLVDKPLGLTGKEVRDLIALAAARGRVLSVFHNRRWDSDFLTVRKLMAEGRLGDVMLFEACWDRHRPAVADHWKEDAGPGGGILSDLGPHLVDQALVLFGAPDRVSADISKQRLGARVDDFFDLRLSYGERIVRLSGSMLVAAPRARFQLHGTRASYVKFGLDPQQGQLKSGLRPGQAGYGMEPRGQFGSMTAPDGARERIRPERGRWHDFYRKLASAIAKGGPVPVDPMDAWKGLRIIEAARLSAIDGRSIDLGGLFSETA